MVMYGTYELPTTIEYNELQINAQIDNRILTYTRVMNENTLKKNILIESGQLQLVPIEPVTSPNHFSSHLLIEFQEEVVLEPKASRKIYTTFPIEWGIFIQSNKGATNIDVFSFLRPKYTLYGNTKEGILCRYWKSSTSYEIPPVNQYYEGIVELKLNNTSSEWIPIKKVVMRAYDMKIYYSTEQVYMNAVMNIKNKSVAETLFIEGALSEEMVPSRELYKNKVPVVHKKMVMLWGI